MLNPHEFLERLNKLLTDEGYMLSSDREGNLYCKPCPVASNFRYIEEPAKFDHYSYIITELL